MSYTGGITFEGDRERARDALPEAYRLATLVSVLKATAGLDRLDKTFDIPGGGTVRVIDYEFTREIIVNVPPVPEEPVEGEEEESVSGIPDQWAIGVPYLDVAQFLAWQPPAVDSVLAAVSVEENLEDPNSEPEVVSAGRYYLMDYYGYADPEVNGNSGVWTRKWQTFSSCNWVSPDGLNYYVPILGEQNNHSWELENNYPGSLLDNSYESTSVLVRGENDVLNGSTNSTVIMGFGIYNGHIVGMRYPRHSLASEDLRDYLVDIYARKITSYDEFGIPSTFGPAYFVIEDLRIYDAEFLDINQNGGWARGAGTTDWWTFAPDGSKALRLRNFWNPDTTTVDGVVQSVGDTGPLYNGTWSETIVENFRSFKEEITFGFDEDNDQVTWGGKTIEEFTGTPTYTNHEEYTLVESDDISDTGWWGLVFDEFTQNGPTGSYFLSRSREESGYLSSTAGSIVMALAYDDEGGLVKVSMETSGFNITSSRSWLEVTNGTQINQVPSGGTHLASSIDTTTTITDTRSWSGSCSSRLKFEYKGVVSYMDYYSLDGGGTYSYTETETDNWTAGGNNVLGGFDYEGTLVIDGTYTDNFSARERNGDDTAYGGIVGSDLRQGIFVDAFEEVDYYETWTWDYDFDESYHIIMDAVGIIIGTENETENESSIITSRQTKDTDRTYGLNRLSMDGYNRIRLPAATGGVTTASTTDDLIDGGFSTGWGQFGAFTSVVKSDSSQCSAGVSNIMRGYGGSLATNPKNTQVLFTLALGRGSPDDQQLYHMNYETGLLTRVSDYLWEDVELDDGRMWLVGQLEWVASGYLIVTP